MKRQGQCLLHTENRAMQAALGYYSNVTYALPFFRKYRTPEELLCALDAAANALRERFARHRTGAAQRKPKEPARPKEPKEPREPANPVYKTKAVTKTVFGKERHPR